MRSTECRVLGVLLALSVLGLSTGAAEVKQMANKSSPVTVEKIPALTALVLPITGSYNQHQEAIAKIMTYVMSKGIMRGAPFGIYHSNPETTPTDSLRWGVCVPVAPDAKAEVPFEIVQFPEIEAAVVTCTGPYEGTSPCYGVLSKWLAESEYTLAGSVQEHWLSDIQSVPAEKLQAKIVYPVMKKK